VGWQSYDITKSVDVRKLPDKPEPVGGEVIDAEPGWVAGVNVQGVSIIGFDHFHPRINPTDPLLIDIVAWNDDPSDWPPGNRWAVIWSFANPRTDPRVGDRMNTEQYLTVYDEQARTPGWYGESTTGGDVTYLPWSDFVVPADSRLNRHGIWVPSECENCPHTIDDHAGGTGSLCTFDDCAGYGSLWQRHSDAMAATRHGWREWLTP